jgi:hypothetical protein
LGLGLFLSTTAENLTRLILYVLCQSWDTNSSIQMFDIKAGADLGFFVPQSKFFADGAWSALGVVDAGGGHKIIMI